MNLPNSITALRILLAPVIACLLLEDDRLRNSLAAGTIGVAALTDFLDGYVARKQSKVTRMGQWFDPLADKICFSTAFAMLAAKQRLPRWVPGVIIGREVLITLFRAYAGARGSSVPASIWGKLKTNSQLMTLLLIAMHPDTDWYESAKNASVAVTIALTLYSGYDYIHKAGKYLAQPGEKDA
ncbi:MAG: CDP-diacylglycerol--glycerol-3-phosphate 3-phosphatidyltransferase [Candidatus Solincola sediminis]|uniref:CDP-diacylglycerol--glycerol-3-phosphate 3-phosphatidyltransferase n=1 Tax=Candidatus Solincola sediminis TaxID=1797199 RepID=A0A1F2WGR2_9ACTN|nr:MAG: CDP-diacylglycerol--glycerol-3-phosphate 3-phosphatidyltransferase [Candidatus Solincola sediminis]OFW58312.1 MAG: CDP-diacylglycerol--glycerol-3-phosphate 3-phosphatidyltransferase [Candidatus Solincola sediminis]